MELGIYTFGDLVPDPRTGQTMAPKQRMDDVLAMARLADEARLDVFGLGEHHTPEYMEKKLA